MDTTCKEESQKTNKRCQIKLYTRTNIEQCTANIQNNKGTS